MKHLESYRFKFRRLDAEKAKVSVYRLGGQVPQHNKSSFLKAEDLQNTLLFVQGRVFDPFSEKKDIKIPMSERPKLYPCYLHISLQEETE